MSLDLTGDLIALFRRVVDIESVSGNETALADAVEFALRQLPHLQVERDGDTVIARTALGRAERVVIAGHLDTVPVAGNLPSMLVGDPGPRTRHGGHEGRRGRGPGRCGRAERADPRHQLDLLRPRGGRGRPELA